LDSPALREKIAGYYTNLKRFDIGVGWLLEALEASGKGQDTLVLLTSDQGPPFARSKTTVYEAGLRVPLLARWPGQLPSGKVVEGLVTLVDLFPTLEEVATPSPASISGEGEAGQVRAENGSPILAGRSLLPLVTETGAEWRRYLFAEFTSHGVQTYYPRRSVRDERYKLILNLLAPRGNPARSMDGNDSWQVSRDSRYEGTPVREAFDRYANPPRIELYDLAQDPNEFVNLAESSEMAGIRQRLMDALKRWREETRDPLLSDSYLAKLTAHHDRLVQEGVRHYQPLENEN
jgi:N-sulfoglucosamine sulfohydrolase